MTTYPAHIVDRAEELLNEDATTLAVICRALMETVPEPPVDPLVECLGDVFKSPGALTHEQIAFHLREALTKRNLHIAPIPAPVPERRSTPDEQAKAIETARQMDADEAELDPDLLLAREAAATSVGLNALQAQALRDGQWDDAPTVRSALRAIKLRPIPAPVSEELEAPKDERIETMKLGGGTANAMRAMGWVVRKPQDPNDCASWEVFHQHRPEQVWLAKDAAEGWQIAEREYSSQLTTNMRPILAPVSEERMIEMAQEVLDAWEGGWCLGTGVSAVAAGEAADAILELLSTTLARPPVAQQEAQGLVERLLQSADHLRVQPVDSARADVELAWAIGRMTEAAALITAQASQLEEARQALHDAKAAMEYWAGCDAGCTPDEASSEIMSSGGAWPSVSYDKVCATLAHIAPGITQEIE